MYSANYLIFDRHYCIIALLHYCIMSFVLCTLFTHAQIPKIPTLHIYNPPLSKPSQAYKFNFSPHPHFLLLILDHPIFQQHSPSPPTCTRYAHNPNPIQQNSKVITTISSSVPSSLSLSSDSPSNSEIGSSLEVMAPTTIPLTRASLVYLFQW